jgi:23S rRNA (adenine2503-C2)-methyltransferase
VNEAVNLIGLDATALAAFFAQQGEKPFRARQLLQWIHQRGETDFARMSDLAKGLREKLAASARIEPPAIVGDTTAEDGTRKWLLKVDAANAVEAVFIPETNRGTLCVSSQAGCTLDCAFCSTGSRASTAT